MNFWRKHFSAREQRSSRMGHEFVIGPVRKVHPFHRKARIYYCIRCKGSFLVCGSQVAILDEGGSPVAADESLRRFATFERGPCPVLEAFVSAGSLTGPAPQLNITPKAGMVDTQKVSHPYIPRRERPLLHVVPRFPEDRSDSLSNRHPTA
jgi:hypothetical protein